MDEETCWLVGLDPETEKLHIVEGRKVGGDLGGLTTVDIRPHCSSSMLVTVKTSKVFATREDAAHELASKARERKP